MGKRSNFERVERDWYPTPREAVVPLVPFLLEEEMYWEPCAGDGALVRHLSELVPNLTCTRWSDIEPQDGHIEQCDVFDEPVCWGRLCITNPPWRRDILHPLIEHLTSAQGSRCWLLFDADWIHTRQSAPYLPRLRKIVSVGRVKWIPDSKMTGKDNCCWYYFTQPSDEPTVFYGRTA